MSGARPIIGLTTYIEPASRGDWTDVPSALLPSAYVEKVETAGGMAVLIPPRLDLDEAMARELLGRLDGLIIAGGADVEPARYGQSAHPAVQAPRPDRDTTELTLARVSEQTGTPLLGICRGMQVMAVAAGGTLEQHIPDRVGHADHSVAPATYHDHPVDTVEGTVTARSRGGRVSVPSYHHQSVLTHPGYRASAWAPDGTLEAMETAGRSDPERGEFRLAVQWHPEVGSDPRLFEALVSAARQRRKVLV